MSRYHSLFFLCLLVMTSGCKKQSSPTHAAIKNESTPQKTALPASNDQRGLLLSYAQFVTNEAGEVTAKPGPARFDLLWQQDGDWKTEQLEDNDSNVFHKSFPFTLPSGKEGIVTLGGTEAIVKFWTRSAPGQFSARILWQKQFGGKFNRMRDAEYAKVLDGPYPDLVVGTHDQGVVALLNFKKNDDVSVTELDKQPNTFIHEIEIGDLDSDGILEVYSTPSEPNKLKGGAQHGSVVRYVPKKHQGRSIVADLGNRHAKEILVDDVDGDGKDELYVAVEALTEDSSQGTKIIEPVEIRRFDADTPADKGIRIAAIPDRLCRFLSVGDIDGDGKKEMVAAAFRSGLWLLKPSSDPKKQWDTKNIDRKSSGFEHAALFADLDNDGKDELYVAADEQGEVRQYSWQGGKIKRQSILKHKVPKALMTWNIVSFPLSLLEP
ncbi:MAG: VCBS repeat-containing protein [Myxococcales bacterium]|nr:MAG: VCBS repeat-containing protein [Myxococcales bacterium]